MTEDPSPSLGDSPEDTAGGPISGLFKSLTNLVATVVAITQTRVELLTIELQQEIHRAAGILVWAFVALFAAGSALLLAALGTIFVFWDTHRVLVSVLVTALFFLIALVATLMLLGKLRSKPALLQSTLAELAKDREQLKSRLKR